MKILFITDYPDKPESELLAKIAQQADVTIMTKKDNRNFHIFEAAKVKILDYEITKRFDKEASAKIKQIIDANNFDIVHAFNSRAITCALQAGKKSKAKILGYRGVTTNNSYLQLENWSSYLNSRLDGIFCVAEAVKQSFLKARFLWFKVPPQKLRTIYKGHRPEWYAGEPANLADYGVPENVTTLCCISRNSAKKGINTLLNAFNALPSELNIHLVLVGAINKNKDALAKIEQCKHPERVHFTGYINNPTAVIRASTILVSASESGEGLPRVVVEAMCVNTPVIATDAGGTPEVVINNETGLLVKLGDAQGLTKAIINVVNNPEEANNRAKAALESINTNFNAETTVVQTLAWYEELLKS